jgi:Collagen triple helix repeat (20 copies)
MKPSRLVIGGAATLALLAGGTAAAATATTPSPVDSSGAIHGCWTNAALNGSHVFVLQDAGTTCPKGTTAISWNATGSQGPAGPQGPQGATGQQGSQGATGATGAPGAQGAPGQQGPAGANGTNGTNGTNGANGQSVTSTQLGSGDPNCPNGGSSFLSTSGTTFACNGATGAAGAPGSPGAPGANGSPGTPGAGAIVTGLSAGNSNCPNGGASVTDGSTNTAYVCNGTDGTQGPQGSPGVSTAGPQGLDTMTVTKNISFTSIDGGFLIVNCPTDHPFVLGGGGEVNSYYPSYGPYLGESFPYGGNEWIVSTPGQVAVPGGPASFTDTLSAYAICAK